MIEYYDDFDSYFLFGDTASWTLLFAVCVVLKLCLTVLICFINYFFDYSVCFIRVTDCSIRVSRSFTAPLPMPIILIMIEIQCSSTALLLLVN